MAESTYVVYDGPTKRSDTTGTYVIDGVELRKGLPQKVESDDLRKELLEGSDRTKGHKFSAAEAPKSQEDKRRERAKGSTNDPAQGSDSSPTTSAASR